MIREIRGARVLVPDGSIVPAVLELADGNIGRVEPARASGRITQPGARNGGAVTMLDATGMLLLPGIVDIHGDAFERQIMPRPEATFPLDMALADTDRQLIANGITTAFHGITYSWEGGLRGRDTVIGLLAALSAQAGRLAADNRTHLRFETHNLDAVDEVLDWIEDGRIDFLAFNDHLPSIRRKSESDSDMLKYAERSRISIEAFRGRLNLAAERSNEVPAAIERLAAGASRAGLAMASHDDYTVEERHWYHERGCRLCEFPRSRAAAEAAGQLGDVVIMGAPNVVRGGSHLNGVRAADLIAEGLCEVLASDYFYPALLHAPFRMVASGAGSLGDIWPLVSRNPARAAGLTDRGEIRAGLRADFVIVDDTLPALPRVAAVVVAGELKYASDGFPFH